MTAHDWYVENRAGFVARSLEPGRGADLPRSSRRAARSAPERSRRSSATSPGFRWA